MWSVLGAILASLLGFGAGSVGLDRVFPQLGYPVVSPVGGPCFAPQPDINLTLTWPDNFVNLTDHRPRLNPNLFSSYPTQFNTDQATCKPTLLTDSNGTQQNSRSYILVRSSVRIASCKTDELAGPYNTQGTNCPDKAIQAAKANRGSCTVQGYTDLRKVAEVKQGRDVFEIFWNPFSHNVGCNYNPKDPNCGPADRSNINLRDFIYVLKKRDGFTPNDPSNNCLTLWDAGSTNKQACSHYFDVYMAEDLYNKFQSPVPATDHSYKVFQFYQQAILNCQEESSFIPLPEQPGLSFPPQFIETPFVAGDFFLTRQSKILPRNNQETAYYQYFILSSRVIDVYRTNLLQIQQSPGAINTCPPGSTPELAPPTPCYSQLGSIYFQKQSNEILTYNVYTRGDTPQTFYFTDQSGKDTNIYKYTITVDKPPTQIKHAPALQLATLQFSSENNWTWATPWCKPALYFYPEKETELNVKLEVEGKLTVSDPPYDENEGWNVIAYPDGTLRNKCNNAIGQLADNKCNNKSLEHWNTRLPARQVGTLEHSTYPYLYYEADVTGVTIPKEGFVWQKEDLPKQLRQLMQQIGFNQKEIEDFLKYWLPRLQDKPYYFVTLLPSEQINNKEKLLLSRPSTNGQQPTTITPDTLIRVRVVLEGLDSPINVKPLANIPSYARKGFTVTDWGGTLIGKSCHDVEVK